LSGWVDWRLAALLLAGGAFGGMAGLRIAGALASRADLARKGFAALVLAVAAYVAWRAMNN
jgi:hypothetical protein